MSTITAAPHPIRALTDHHADSAGTLQVAAVLAILVAIAVIGVVLKVVGHVIRVVIDSAASAIGLVVGLVVFVVVLVLILAAQAGGAPDQPGQQAPAPSRVVNVR